MTIDFTIWATSEATFKSRWIAAGILEDGPGYVFRPAYRDGVELTAAQGWPGIITKTPAVMGENMEVITPAVLVDGWHCNAMTYGAVAEAMTAGLAQTDENGAPLGLFDRTWAAYIFGLTEVMATAPATGFPYGATTANSSVQYGDPASLSSPANAWQ